jgi:glucose-fructose oxidoreductase
MVENQSGNLIEPSGDRKVRYAVAGLGWIAQAAVLPAFANAENSELVALVSDDAEKLKQLGDQYNIEHWFTYAEYDDCLNSGLIDAVYIALPNQLHHDFTSRAANAAIHVLCEKPMAITEAECEQMIHDCENNNVKLMIAYRLHFEAANMDAVEIVRSGQIGQPLIFNSVFSQQVEQGDIRLRQATGGGTIYDIGIYCINAARYLFQDEPIEVFATTANTGEQRFSEVETTSSAILRFPNEKLATFTCSFGVAPVSTYQIVGTQGDLRLDDVYSFETAPKQKLTINQEQQEREFDPQDQFAAELIYFSDCILQDRDPEPSGTEGLNDVRIIQALYQSIATGRWVKIINDETAIKPSADQVIQRSPSETPELIHASDPSGNS